MQKTAFKIREIKAPQISQNPSRHSEAEADHADYGYKLNIARELNDSAEDHTVDLSSFVRTDRRTKSA